jgi:hypothetical protein
LALIDILKGLQDKFLSYLIRSKSLCLRSQRWQQLALDLRKIWVTLLLEENDLWDVIKDVVALPIDPQQLAVHKKKEVNAKRMIMNDVNDHLNPHISEKKTTE